MVVCLQVKGAAADESVQGLTKLSDDDIQLFRESKGGTGHSPETEIPKSNTSLDKLCKQAGVPLLTVLDHISGIALEDSLPQSPGQLTSFT
jgi:hypothetical protein